MIEEMELAPPWWRWTFDRQGVSCSADLARLAGLPAERVTARRLLRRLSAADRKRVMALLRALRTEGAASPIDIRFTAASGELHSAWLGCRLERSGQGRAIAIAGTIREVARMPAPESPATDGEDWDQTHLIQSLEQLGVGVFEIRPTSGVVRLSLTARRLSGLSPEQETISRDGLLEQVHPEDRHLSLNARASEHSAAARPMELRVAQVSGGYAWRETRIWPVRDSAGEVTLVRGIITNIDGRKQRETEVSALREWMDIALDAGGVGLWSRELDTGRTTCSDEVRRLLNLGPDETPGVRDLLGRIHPEDRRRLIDTTRRGREEIGRTMQGRFRFRAGEADETGAEAWRWVHIHGQFRRGPEGGLRLSGALRDVTTEVEREAKLCEAKKAAEAAAEAKARFLATMTHEIRTPLNAVLGMSSLMLETELSEEQRRLVDTAHTAGEHLLCLINNLLDLTKLEAERVELEDQPFDLAGEVRAVSQMMSIQAIEKGLELKLSLDDGLPAMVSGDPGRVRQILLNLVGNAIKFTDAGEVAIDVRTTASDTVRFEVSDTGVGVPEEARHRLFREFEQAGAGETRRYGGSGLGLSISRRLAELMGGRIGMAPNSSGGSTFWFELPLPASKAAGAAQTEAPAVPEGVRILAAEDNPANRMLLETLLGRMGCELELAEDGRKAVEAAEARRFDVILMDVEMPEMDGIEAAKAIRAGQGPNAATPILALTAHGPDGRREEFAAAGFDDIVGKPFKPAILARSLAELAGSAPGEKKEETPMTQHAESYAEQPLVDHGALDPILGATGPAVMRNIIQSFWDAAEDMLGAIEQTIDAGDPEAMGKAAHTMKGASSNIGAGRVAAIARAMEGASIEEGRVMAQQMRRAMEETRPALEAAVDKAA